MNEYGDQVTRSTPNLAEEKDRETSRQKTSRRFLWRAGAIGISVVLIVSIWIGFLNTRCQPLRADANTLYLANWSKNLDHWSGGSQWHWQQPGVISSEGALGTPLLLAPYHPSNADLEVDAQIKVLGYSFRDETIFGIVIGVDRQGNSYRCGLNWGRAIERLQGDPSEGIAGFTEDDSVGRDFSTYVTLRVTVEKNVMTLFFDEQQFAQATVTAFHADGSLGVFATNGAVEVQGFRVEKLL
jgi:hypothetical protein